MNRRVKFIIWWRKQAVPVRLFITSLIGLLFIFLLYIQKPAEDFSQVGSNLLVFLLVNLIIVVLGLLGFLIGRNVVKLVFDRKRNILGSKLRMRLVLAFVSLTLVPTVIIFVLASGLLSSAMEGWFGEHIESVFNGALEIAKQQNAALKQEVESNISELSKSIGRDIDKTGLERHLELFREQKNLSSISLYSTNKSNILKIESATSVIENFKEPEISPILLDRVLKEQKAIIAGEEKDASEFIRGYATVTYADKPAILVVSKRINPEISHAMNSVNESYKEFEQIQLFKGPLKSAYLLTLAVITGLILFSAIWFGFYMAKELSVPIQKLAEGTRAVSKGNYDFKIKEIGDDEISYLIKSFNAMTQDIKSSREDSEKNRVYIETIIGNLAVGVIAIDMEEQIININSSASLLFKINEPRSVVGKKVKEIIGEDAYSQINPILQQLEELSREKTEVKEKELLIKSGNDELKVLCTAGRVIDNANKSVAIVLIFDDITELVKAQHMSAWREVARRIAHEIKNPLTPIQLSAQRLQKILTEKNMPPAVSESTQTIIENVDSIKRLANEFSNFARMPSAELGDCDINNLITSCLTSFADTHTEITFQFIADNKMPQVKADKEQIRRVVINLLDNAIAAVNIAASGDGISNAKRIVIKTIFLQAQERFQIEIADSGTGIPDSDKVKIFDPYYTTKQGGTGLGLAIVSSIISEHQGSIKILDNAPQGSRFIVEIPVAVKNSTQRKFAS
jgi:two-component system nitrogen regulation sensor histidine kinase NtrY